MDPEAQGSSWQQTSVNADIDWILISPGIFMDLKLGPNPEKFVWREVWRDRAAVIYKKLPQANEVR